MNLRTQVLSALKWLAFGKLLGQVFAWAVTILVIRILNPADYGVMAVASAFIAFFALFGELGLGSALIQRQERDESLLRQTFGFVTVANSLLCLLMVLAAPWIAKFYDEPALKEILWTLAAVFPLMALRSIPQAMLERDLSFKGKSVVEFIGTICSGIVALTLALQGFGVWSLVWSFVASELVLVVGFNAIASFRAWPSFSLTGMRKVITFGGLVTAEHILWFFYSRVDVFILGKLLTRDALGLYSVASHLAALPLQKIAPILNQVAFPAYARIQSDKQKVGNYLGKSIRVLSVVTLPVFLGISSLADELVLLVLGERWREAALPLAAMCLVMPLRMVTSFFAAMLRGCGRQDVSLINALIAAAIIPIAVATGGQWGLVGASLAWVIGYTVVTIIQIARTLPVVNVTWQELLSFVKWPVIASTTMYLAVITAKPAMIAYSGAIVGVMLSIAIGIATYAALILISYRQGIREAVDLLKG